MMQKNFQTTGAILARARKHVVCQLGGVDIELLNGCLAAFRFSGVKNADRSA